MADRNRQKKRTTADRISNLPDNVLCHILSFLPTEEAVATSVLSKRWKPLWISVPTLDFDKYRFLKAKEELDSSFTSFVYAAILSRGFHQQIKSFKLACDECPFRDVQVWLNAAIQRRVESLEISFYPSSSQLPRCILASETLVVLKLRCVNIDAFSSSVDLPSLKTLHLKKEVEFLNPQFLMDFLYGCPVLEDLKIDQISFQDESFEGEVRIFPKLVRAEVNFYGDFHIPVKAFCNVQSLHLIKWDVDIPVFTNLRYLKLFGGHVDWRFALDILNHCPKLQTFVFSLVCYEEVWPEPCFVPECFSSHLKKCFLEDYTGAECQRRFVKYAMQNSTSLRTMTICSSPTQNQQKKLEMVKELTSYPRSSAGCELTFCEPSFEDEDSDEDEDTF